MEAEVATTAPGSSSSQLDFPMHCVTCGIHKFLTPRTWACDVCREYFICEGCYKGSLDNSSGPSQVHCRDHPLSAHVTMFSCDGCESSPIWNFRWHCKVCPDYGLCEVCYGGLDAADMPSEHLKEHRMIKVEVIHSDMFLKLGPRFTKPVDPQWFYNVRENLLQESGFGWMKRKAPANVLGTSHASVVKGDAIMRTLLHTNEEQINFNYRSSFQQHTSKATPIQRKHKIFLSHAGPQKDFVEQLNLDLSRVHHFGIFFDKDDESLPKGEPFPSRIFDAANHCELAILVISNDYFVRKWPMLELGAFVKAQKARPQLKILPVFYKLSVHDFKQSKRQQSYVRHWMKLLGSSAHDGDIREWEEALEVISGTNGLEYDRRMGEVAFRREIVETVCKRVKIDLVWDDSHVQGKLRLHEMIHEKIQSSTNSCTSTLFMGLYGMGGSGKTTMCKVIGNQVMEKYLGQVCHIEFRSMDIVQLYKKLLQCISSFELSLGMMIDEEQALNLLKQHFPTQKICLMIDNVLDDQASIEEAKTLLDLPFPEGSLILDTSRSRMTFEKLKVKWGALMKIPSLTMDEAKALFMYHTGCDSFNLLEDQKKVMEELIDGCNFKVDGTVAQEYHPLALKVLGTRAGPNPKEWVDVDIDFKYYGNESKHNIFSILRLSYDTLNPEYKKMFLDIALSRNIHSKGININGVTWQMRCLYDKNDEQSKLVKILQANSLVEFYDAQSRRIYIHDLYREFAIMEVEKNEVKHSPCCCFFRASNGNHFVQKRKLRIYDQPISRINEVIMSCRVCAGARLFSIQGCPNLESVDVPHMQSLKIFEVYGGCPRLQRVNLEGALNLQCLIWVGFEGEYPELTSLESLEGLWLVNDKNEPPSTPLGCLDFSRNSNLEVLFLTYLPLHLINLNQAVSLKKLFLNNCQRLERFQGLEALVQLEDVTLRACCSLVEFLSLVKFPSLKSFILQGAAKLKQMHGFAGLSALEFLSLCDGAGLMELPGIEACIKLIELDLSGTGITDCSWLSAMKELTYIDLSRTKITAVPDCGDLCKLSLLWLPDCQLLECVGNSTGIIHSRFPKSLRTFSAWSCPRLKTIPQFENESALVHLDIRQTSVSDVSSVEFCRQLEMLGCTETPITSLPDLSSLTRLTTLDVRQCALLTTMDNTKSLPALENLGVLGCAQLLSLPDLSSSTQLKMLFLYGCPLVDPNSVKLPGGRTVDMETEDDVATQSENDDDAQDSESRAVLVVTDLQEPELAHNPWRCASLLSLVAMVGSCCGGLGGDEANAD